MNEIKLEQSSVEKALTDLKQAIQSLDPSFHKEFKGNNVLDMMDKLNEINLLLEEFLIQYQELLNQNQEGTKQSIETLKQTDQELGTNIRVMR
ncbi:YwqI/YxiC family protein [Oceanobacillus senegalensis]|uniref:YwqI/YxiC family protein n=1 Tax=Oceanobacillus senegalensis TaxID=1936063 RepID=UPI000A30A973|nr:YwqI/YxiC family protein [Oceanobacillus senegalensis]